MGVASTFVTTLAAAAVQFTEMVIRKISLPLYQRDLLARRDSDGRHDAPAGVRPTVSLPRARRLVPLPVCTLRASAHAWLQSIRAASDPAATSDSRPSRHKWTPPRPCRLSAVIQPELGITT